MWKPNQPHLLKETRLSFSLAPPSTENLLNRTAEEKDNKTCATCVTVIMFETLKVSAKFHLDPLNRSFWKRLEYSIYVRWDRDKTLK